MLHTWSQEGPSFDFKVSSSIKASVNTWRMPHVVPAPVPQQSFLLQRCVLNQGHFRLLHLLQQVEGAFFALPCALKNLVPMQSQNLAVQVEVCHGPILPLQGGVESMDQRPQVLGFKDHPPDLQNQKPAVSDLGAGRALGGVLSQL